MATGPQDRKIARVVATVYIDFGADVPPKNRILMAHELVKAAMYATAPMFQALGAQNATAQVSTSTTWQPDSPQGDSLDNISADDVTAGAERILRDGPTGH